MFFQLGRHILKSRNSRNHLFTHFIKMSTEKFCAVSLEKVVTELEKFAPKELAESWDNTGLLVEPYTPRQITKILLTNDLTEDVALEAEILACEMIISYHPPIFAPLKSIVQRSWKERVVSYLLEKRIALYSPHTSWDSVRGGVNDWLASAFFVAESKPILQSNNPDFGAGRLLHLSSGIPLSDAVNKIKELTRLSHVRIAVAKGKSMTHSVQRVALCAGSGSSVLKGVDADLYLTGEMLHHDVLDATQKGITVILTNHSDSERGFLREFANYLHKHLNEEVEVFVSKVDKDPLITV